MVRTTSVWYSTILSKFPQYANRRNLSLGRFNISSSSTRRVFSGTRFEPENQQRWPLFRDHDSLATFTTLVMALRA
ncbi:hypothetical protein TNCV_2263791 [Trichonephila clavipes]|nr:hypothetical protein TNCV_2263791 [Trichonephila clavipes]